MLAVSVSLERKLPGMQRPTSKANKSCAIMFDLPTFLVLAQQNADVAEGTAEVPEGMAMLIRFLPFIVIGLLFYFILLRPDRRKRQELETMLSQLKKNDRVVTVGGIFGTVVQAPQGAEDVTLKVDESSNTRIRVLRSSISRVLTAENGKEST